MSRPGEKKVTDWEYADGSLKVKIPVMMISCTRRGDTPTRMPAGIDRQTITTFFRVKMNDPQVHEEDVNIDALKTRVMAEVASKLKIEWRQMLYISIGHHEASPADDVIERQREVNANVKLSWSLVQIATVGDKPIQRACNTAYKDDDNWVYSWSTIREGWPNVGEHDSHRSDDKLTTMVDDTPANRHVLQRLAFSMRIFGEALSKQLAPDTAERAFAQLSSHTGPLVLGGMTIFETPDGTKKDKAKNPTRKTTHAKP